MKCQCCDCMLSDYETSLKSVQTEQYVDTCITCLSESCIKTYTLSKLQEREETDE